MTPPTWVLLGDAAPDLAAALQASHGPLPLIGVADLNGSSLQAGLSVAYPPHRYVLLATATRDPYPAEHAWRAWLLARGAAFEALYPDARGNWQTPLQELLGLAPRPESPAYAAWACERCADPVCEHRLFTALLSQRAAASR